MIALMGGIANAAGFRPALAYGAEAPGVALIEAGIEPETTLRDLPAVPRRMAGRLPFRPVAGRGFFHLKLGPSKYV